MSEDVEQDGYNPHKPSIHMGYVGKYLDYSGKSLLEIGCGTGDLCVFLAKSGARKVTGVDIDRERIETAKRKATKENVDHLVRFEHADFVATFQAVETFDIAFSMNAFEHILSPLKCLQKIHDCLASSGMLGAIFGPLWLSPYGAHMWGFTSIPWVHLIFPEAVVLRVRKEVFRPDEDPEQYEDIRGHLNRMTIDQFRRHVRHAGFEPQVLRVNPAQDRGKYAILNAAVNCLPALQEFGAHQVLIVLRKCH